MRRQKAVTVGNHSGPLQRDSLRRPQHVFHFRSEVRVVALLAVGDFVRTTGVEDALRRRLGGPWLGRNTPPALHAGTHANSADHVPEPRRIAKFLGSITPYPAPGLCIYRIASSATTASEAYAACPSRPP